MPKTSVLLDPVKAAVMTTDEETWELEVCLTLLVIGLTAAFLIGRWSTPSTVTTPSVTASAATQTNSETPAAVSASAIGLRCGTAFVTNNTAEVYHRAGCRCVAEYAKKHGHAPRALRACTLCGL